MTLVARILQYPSCEVFSYLEWNHLNWCLSDERKWEGITRAFGTDTWKGALKLAGMARERFLLDCYKEQLRSMARARFTWHFAMHDENDRLLYWLFFATNSDRGLEEMKRAMWKVDESGRFRFSDQDNPNQLSMFEVAASDEWLAKHLHKRFLDQTLQVQDIRLYVLMETPPYKYKSALALLEERDELVIVSASPKRKRKTFNELTMRVRFQIAPKKASPPPPRQGRLF